MSGVETLMPNMAGRAGADPDAARLAEYRARAGANRSAVTPILQGIQGRRTGLIIGKRVSKDSDGFEDIDAFWDLASEANDDSDDDRRRRRGGRGSGARATRASTASQSSLELGLGSTPGDASVAAAAAGAGARTRKSSLPMPPPRIPRRDSTAEEEEAKTSPTKRVTRRSSGASSLALSLGNGATPGGVGLDDSMALVGEGEETPAAGPLAGKPRRLDFLKGGKLSLGGASSVGGDTPARQEEEEEPATEEERGEGVAASMAVGGGGFDDDDWAAGNDDGGFGPEGEEEPAMEEDEEEAAAPAAAAAKKGEGAKAAVGKGGKGKSKKPAPRVSEGGEATELSDYDEDDEEEGADPTRTGERHPRRRQQAAATRRVRYTEYHNEQQKGKPLLAPEEDGVGPVGERRSTRRRVQPVEYWRGEKPVYEVQKVEVETDVGGKRKVEEVEVMTVRAIQVVEKTPEPAAWARRGKKRKAANNPGGKKGGSKSRKAGGGGGDGEEKLPALNPAKIHEAHPAYQYVADGSGKARVWDERRAATVAKKVVAPRAGIQMRALENGGVPGVSLEAGHAFRLHQITRTAEDRADSPDAHLAGYPGWVAGHLVVRPRRGKDPENVGPCSQVFHVLKGQRNALELAIGEQLQEEGAGFDEKGASRFLLSPGDTFFLPPHNTYRLFNHSKKASAEVFWTIVKPWSEGEGEGSAPAEESQTQQSQPPAAAAAPPSTAKKPAVAPARRSLLERNKRRSTATVAAAAEEDESVASGSEEGSEEGEGGSDEDVMSSSGGEEEGSEQSSGSEEDESGSDEEEEEGGSDEE